MLHLSLKLHTFKHMEVPSVYIQIYQENDKNWSRKNEINSVRWKTSHINTTCGANMSPRILLF
jgi:hypothetical protein